MFYSSFMGHSLHAAVSDQDTWDFASFVKYSVHPILQHRFTRRDIPIFPACPWVLIGMLRSNVTHT